MSYPNLKESPALLDKLFEFTSTAVQKISLRPLEESLLRKFNQTWERDCHWWRLTSDGNTASKRLPRTNPDDFDPYKTSNNAYGAHTREQREQLSLGHLKTKIQDLEEENKSLKSQIQRATYPEHGNQRNPSAVKIQELEDENKKLKSQLQRPSHQEYGNQQSRHGVDPTNADYREITRLQDKIRTLEEKNERLQMDIFSSRTQKEDLLNSLSQSMNIQMSTDERNLENINIKVRPSWVSEQYGLFLSQAWLDAKQALDLYSSVKISEEDKCEFLCKLITSACHKARGSYEEIKRKITDLFVDPLGKETYDPMRKHQTSKAGAHSKVQQTNVASSTLSNELENAISKELRMRSENIDPLHWVQDLLENGLQLFGNLSPKGKDEIFRSARIRSYVLKACTLGWQMTLQSPPVWVQIPDKGTPFDAHKHDLTFDSTNPSSRHASIRYCQHPMLCHGEKIMNKAKVHVDGRK